MLAKKFRLPINQWPVNRPRIKSVSVKGYFFHLKTNANNLPYSRFGVIVSRKTLKKAVERNQLKRIIFNFIRAHKLYLTPNKDVLISTHFLPSQTSKQEIHIELLKILTPIFNIK